jgi:hypothetical protein
MKHDIVDLLALWREMPDGPDKTRAEHALARAEHWWSLHNDNTVTVVKKEFTVEELRAQEVPEAFLASLPQV